MGEKVKEEVKEEKKVEGPEKKALPKGVDQKTIDMAMDVVKSGYKANQDPDAIKSALFGKGITFSKLARVFNYCAVELGLEVDPKTLKERIETAVKNVKFKYDEPYENLMNTAEKMAEEIKGATAARFMTLFKKKFAEAKKEFPRKTAPARGRMGVVNKTVIDVFAANKTASEKDLFEALKKVTKTEKNAADYTRQYYKMAYALANGLTALKVLTIVAKEGSGK
jgi:hypothetical protein